jgi:hypothetical protein
MNAKKMLMSLVPWVLFTVVVERKGSGSAAFAALAAAAVAAVLVAKARETGIKILDVAGVGTFLALGMVALTGDAAVRGQVSEYGRGIAALVLAAVMLGSVLVVPFTEQYARESVPSQYWGSPVFRSVNRHLSAAWGLAALVSGGSHLLAGHLQASGHDTMAVRLLLNWAVPAVLGLAAMGYTKRIAGSSAQAA